MKLISTTLLALLCSFGICNAQFTIKGSVTDTLNMSQLPSASVVLIRTTDSVIETFTRTAADGTFQLHIKNEGKYLIRVTFPNFVDYIDVINVKNPVTDVGLIPMISKEHLLKEFVLTQQYAAIKIKGDTTEYMADSFKVKENATVEDLLKRLPGIQVDKNGQITAQGETVQKILVDGEEFFSDDPKVVTQGLQANVLSKVQVFDKKSDQAEFTGIDDGQKTKTINLELKDDKKKGYFGKLDAGAGTDGYFQDQAMFNAFKNKRQLSVFGIASNTDKVGLGWQDNGKFGSGSGVTEISDDGGIMTTVSSNDEDVNGWDGSYNGEGLPKTWTGGVHYADKWNEDKDHITANYRYAMQDVELNGNTTTQYVLGNDTSTVNSQRKNQFSKGERHGIDGMYEWKIDTNTSLKLTFNAGYKTAQTLSEYNTTTSLLIDTLNARLDSNYRKITSTSYASFINTDLLFRKKFAKKGRTLSIDVKENYKDAKNNGQLTSNTINDAIATDSLINQRKVNSNNTLAFEAKAIYTEPLSKVAYLELNYGVTVNNSTSENLSYDAPLGTANFDSLDRSYSANYKYNILVNQAGLNFKFVFKKFNFNFGSDVANAGYLQTDLLNGDTTHRYNYVNLYPKAAFTYSLSKQTVLKFTYQGSSQQPSITQIQPLRQDTDPLNITIGNPGLKQEFINNFYLRFNDYKVLTNRYTYASVSFKAISNDISTHQTTNTLTGVNTTQFINVDGDYSGYAYLGGGFKLKALDMNVGLQLNTVTNHTTNLITTTGFTTTTATNTSNNNSYGFGPYFNYYKQDKYDFSFNPSVEYNVNTATISTFSTKYWMFNGSFNGSMQLPKKFEVGTTVDIMLRQKTVVFTSNNDVVKWNAFIGWKFAKKDQFEIRANVNDILNQNIGYSRTAQGAIITQNSYNTIRRYGMINLIWNFSHTPAGMPPAPAGGMMIH